MLHISAYLTLYVLGIIISINIYDVLIQDLVFMTSIHGILLNPFFLIAGAYIGTYTLYLLLSHIIMKIKMGVMKCNHHLSVIHAKRIVRKKDLITATWYFRFYLFHSDCFKRQQVFISRFLPVNTLFNFFLIIYGLIFGSILMITEPSIIWLTFFFPFLSVSFLLLC